jgi:hypothetical protein
VDVVEDEVAVTEAVVAEEDRVLTGIVMTIVARR